MQVARTMCTPISLVTARFLRSSGLNDQKRVVGNPARAAHGLQGSQPRVTSVRGGKSGH